MSADLESLTFTVDSLLLGELGERLVTKNYIALAELVKNAYDADALQVTVSFINAKGKAQQDPNSEIRIVDNGHGMTFKQIKEFWMRIATPNKLRHPISPYYGRKKTGSKGIGRFACRRLAKKLILESVAKNEETKKNEYTWVEFNWSKYKAGETLTEIPNEYNTKITRKRKTGLSLRLIGLQDAWTERQFNVLRRQVLGLSIVSGIQREGYPYDPGFKIIFNAPEFEKGRGELSKQVMNAGWGRLQGEVDDVGTAVIKLNAMKIGRVQFELPDKYPDISGTCFDIAIIWRVKKYCRDPSTLTLGLIDEIFDDWSGVRVYLEGFRVYPYGEPGNDWLEIDEITARRLTKIDDIFSRVADNLIGLKERRPLLSHPRNRNLLGQVKVTNLPKEKFIITASREGFIENESIFQLKTLIKASLMWLTLYYAHFLYLIEIDKMKEAVYELEEIKSVEEEVTEKISLEVQAIPIINAALNVISETTENISNILPSETRKMYIDNTDVATKVIKESVHHMEKQINFLRTVASTGALMLVFTHESKQLCGKLDTYAGKLDRILTDVEPSSKKELIDMAKDLRKTRDRFENQIKLFSGVTKGLSDVKRKKIRFNKIYKEVINSYDTLMKDFNIKIISDFDKKAIIGPILEAEIYSILINLISNAIKAVIANSSHNIKVTLYKTEKGTILRIYDDGIGLSKDSWDLVLQPLVADPEGRLYKALEEKIKFKNLITIGEGSGLGLSIVNDIVTSYGKYMSFIEPEKPWKTCVEVGLP